MVLSAREQNRKSQKMFPLNFVKMAENHEGVSICINSLTTSDENS